MASEIPNHKTRSVACLVAGCVITAAFAPYNQAWLAVLSVAVLFNYWQDVNPRAAFFYGYLFGFGMFGTGVNWLHISINLFGGVNLAGAYVLTYILVAFLALYPGLVGYIGNRFFYKNRISKLLVVMPALWTIFEWGRSWIFTGFPWLNLGYSQIDTPLAGLAPVTGVYGISWLAAVSSATLIYIVFANWKKRIISASLLFPIWLLCEVLKPVQWTGPEHNSLSVALIQGAIPQEIKWKPEQKLLTLETYLELSGPHWGKDLIVWPETAIPMLYHQADDLVEKLAGLTKQHDTDLLTGIPIKDPISEKYFNSMIVIGAHDGRYDKRHLVPFGEYLPFDSLLRPLLNYLNIPMSDFSSGNNDKPLLEIAGGKAGVSICYEIVFGEEIIDALPEANFLLNISNDAWFGDSLAPHQHLQMARMRALETGRYLLRATNTGISAVINEKGKIISQSPQFNAYALSADINSIGGMTPYAVAGNYPIIIFVLIILTVLFLQNRKIKIS